MATFKDLHIENSKNYIPKNHTLEPKGWRQTDRLRRGTAR